MKFHCPKLLFFVAVFTATTLFAESSLVMGKTSIPISFAEGNGLSSSVRSAVIADLNLCFSFAESVSNVIVTTNGLVEFREFEVPRPVPSALDGSLSWDGAGIVVSSNLCATYRGIVESGTNSIPDLLSLQSLFSSLNATNIATISVLEANNLFWMPSGEEAPSGDDIRAVLSQCATLRFHRPSLLAFRPGTSLSDGTIPDREAAVVATDRVSGTLFNVFGVIHTGSSWKLYLF